MSLSRPLFVYFIPFLYTISKIQIEKCIDGVLWIRTRGHMMVGADDTTELWWLPKMKHNYNELNESNKYRIVKIKILNGISFFGYNSCHNYLLNLHPTILTHLFHTLKHFCKGVKIYHFSSEIIFGNFYRHLAIFSGHTGSDQDEPTDSSVHEPLQKSALSIFLFSTKDKIIF